MDISQKLQAERQEYDLLLNQGVEFSIPVEYIKKEKIKREGLFSFLPATYKTIKISKEKKFVIKQPVLKVLDRLSKEYLKLEYENSLDNEDQLQLNKAAVTLVREKAIVLAKIVAIAVLGMEYTNEKKLKYYTGLFYRSLTPSKLVEVALLINTIGNLVDFTNSIRLLAPLRTAIPTPIEENKEA